jgi:hypothetical protein
MGGSKAERYSKSFYSIVPLGSHECSLTALERPDMSSKLNTYHRALLYEIQWNGGVLFAAKGVDAEFYQQLVSARYIYVERVSGDKYRYELTLQGRKKLAQGLIQSDGAPKNHHGIS